MEAFLARIENVPFKWWVLAVFLVAGSISLGIEIFAVPHMDPAFEAATNPDNF
ncbi:MAG: hypothetical protein Q8K11_01980 [Phenylobacterium sp.]|uniref:hypothetical protein n=1 Tax=Phenylobacterium sp. TaxID=1871053 RepID=UPI002730A8F1|nr:hypothetical protein [Phenylobacterium sp.]MDP2008922.1 hypothetical protein [Phenylobacterium sp.]